MNLWSYKIIIKSLNSYVNRVVMIVRILIKRNKAIQISKVKVILVTIISIKILIPMQNLNWLYKIKITKNNNNYHNNQEKMKIIN